MLRNFGGPSTTGPRLALERLLKIGYGVSILGTVPLIVLPLQAPFASVVGLKNEPGAAYANPFREHIVTALVIGGRALGRAGWLAGWLGILLSCGAWLLPFTLTL